MVCLILLICCHKITPSFLNWRVIVLKTPCTYNLSLDSLSEGMWWIQPRSPSLSLYKLILDMSKVCKTGVLHCPNQFNSVVENEFMIIHQKTIMHLTLLSWSRIKLYTIDLNLGSLCGWMKIIALVKIIKWLHTALQIEWTLAQCY